MPAKKRATLVSAPVFCGLWTGEPPDRASPARSMAETVGRRTVTKPVSRGIPNPGFAPPGQVDPLRRVRKRVVLVAQRSEYDQLSGGGYSAGHMPFLIHR